ncbi:MAG TPA: pentapeptide repeat-containing protein [Aggregatilineales bacterium]|nr:pentapeptide repeat-containing protein [Aggregatilineales bacterium]
MTPPIEHHDRLTEIKAIHRDYRNFYQLLRGVVLVAVLAGIGVLIFSSDLPSYWQNIYVTIVGAIGTVFIIDQRAEQRAIKERKEELIIQMGSSDNGIAVGAAKLMESKGWLQDGSAQKAFLLRANLRGVSLSGAQLQSAILTDANLEEAYLPEVNLFGSELTNINLKKADLEKGNLQRTWLMFADLDDAQLSYANLQTAHLHQATMKSATLCHASLQDTMMWSVNLEKAKLAGANLHGATMLGANLQDADFTDSVFSTQTQLPDASYWTPDTDLTRFTDPNHPQFWRSTDPSSPAYRPPPKPSI